MFRAVFDFFGGKKIEEKYVSLRSGNLKIILKERDNRRYMYLRFSYSGNIQYHVLHKEDLDEVIDIMTKFKSQM